MAPWQQLSVRAWTRPCADAALTKARAEKLLAGYRIRKENVLNLGNGATLLVQEAG